MFFVFCDGQKIDARPSDLSAIKLAEIKAKQTGKECEVRLGDRLLFVVKRTLGRRIELLRMA